MLDCHHPGIGTGVKMKLKVEFGAATLKVLDFATAERGLVSMTKKGHNVNTNTTVYIVGFIFEHHGHA